MKLDLNRKSVVEAQRRDAQGNIVPVQVEAPLSEVVTQMLEQGARNFSQALSYKPLIAKLKTGAQDFTDSDFDIIAGILNRRKTSEKIAFAEMVQELNPKFSFEEYEKTKN
jgi:hypothetical protein